MKQVVTLLQKMKTQALSTCLRASVTLTNRAVQQFPLGPSSRALGHSEWRGSAVGSLLQVLLPRVASLSVDVVFLGKVEKEAAVDKEANDKYMCWCGGQGAHPPLQGRSFHGTLTGWSIQPSVGHTAD